MQEKLPVVMLAEDDLVIAELFELMMTNSVHKIVIVRDGSKAVEQYRDNEFDIIFMDIHMPLMDGQEATRRIRELQRSGNRPGDLRIIGITASNDARDKQACLQAGMDNVIVKPFTKQDLERAVMINEKRSRKPSNL